MAFFSVIVHGDGIRIHHDSQTASVLGFESGTAEDDDPIIGFYTARFVWATSEPRAVEEALSLVAKEWARPPLKEINRGTEPQLTVDSVEKIGALTYFFSKAGKGFTFYSNEHADGGSDEE